MATIFSMIIALTRVFLAASVGLYQDFVMITDFSNKVLKNNSIEVSEISTRSLLDCSAQCGLCCSCFGFNKLSNICRVFNTCDWAGETEYEEGWIYHSIKRLGKIHITIQLESTCHPMNFTSPIHLTDPFHGEGINGNIKILLFRTLFNPELIFKYEKFPFKQISRRAIFTILNGFNANIKRLTKLMCQ